MEYVIERVTQIISSAYVCAFCVYFASPLSLADFSDCIAVSQQNCGIGGQFLKLSLKVVTFDLLPATPTVNKAEPAHFSLIT